MNASGLSLAIDIRLRDARPGELDRLSRPLEEVYDEFQPHFPDDLWRAYLGEIADVRSRRGSELIVAELRVALSARSVSTRRHRARRLSGGWSGWASIRTLAVLPEARGRGVGEALTRECLRRAYERGAAAVGLHTNPFMAAANRLYERLGFRRAPEFDIEIGEMFTVRRLPPRTSWQAQAFRLDLKEG